MNNIITMRDREPTHSELNSLTEQRDRLVIESISRSLGTPKFSMAKMYPRGKWVQYADKIDVFSFDGKEKLLFGPPMLIRETNQFVQRVEYLYDKADYDFTPTEADIDEKYDGEDDNETG